MLTSVSPASLKAIFFRSDVAVALGLVAILLVMIIPLPSMLLDLFLSVNITAALLILIITLYTVKALDFSVFPSVLLVTTLFRLSLNVASTRLILLHGHEGPDAAGAVIQSFGQFVVGGNYVVGIVIFAILVVINFMVITKGAGRVAEVAARFTLDAMPGKQMAIDADLNAGLINETEAKTRRETIAHESEFYGAMDGASKFVRGDAVAGILITLINIGAGFIIGVVQMGMTAGDAAANYTILTVGDGLVGQIPALVISTAAGILVTRSGAKESIGDAFKSQFVTNPQALWVVSGILLLFALIPGLPHIPFLLLSGLIGYGAYRLQAAATSVEGLESGEAQSELPGRPPEERYEDMLGVDLLTLEVGYGLIPLVDAAQDGELLPRIKGVRKQYALEMGFIVPPVHIKDNLELNPNAYSILLKGVTISSGEILPGHCMAMNPGTASEPIKGVATTEPAFGLPATWIAEEKRERAQMAGYTVVDNVTVVVTHLSELIRRNAHELVGRQEVQNLLDTYASGSPKVVEELVPDKLPLGGVMRVLQNLLRENVPIRDMRSILETLADWATVSRDPDALTEYVRQALARTISARFAMEDGTLSLMLLDRDLESRIQAAVHTTAEGSYLDLDPGTAQGFLSALNAMVQEGAGGGMPVLLCQPSIRQHVRKLTERFLPGLVVLSHNEISAGYNVKSIGTVRINNAG